MKNKIVFTVFLLLVNYFIFEKMIEKIFQEPPIYHRHITLSVFLLIVLFKIYPNITIQLGAILYQALITVSLVCIKFVLHYWRKFLTWLEK